MLRSELIPLESLYDYFSQFGEVQECTVMRDGASGRSRGFGFLTFKNPKHVNEVMVKEHFLDGKIVRPTLCEHNVERQIALGSSPQAKLERMGPRHRSRRKSKYKCLHTSYQIDPKRAIPRDEQEKTSKIFVGGVSQDATEDDFTKFFEQFGRVVDATLMMDKDTGRPRGFGFVTFDSEAAVERCLDHQPLEILGKPIEVKKAQPRGKIGEEEHDPRGNRRGGKFGKEDRYDNQQSAQSQPQQNQNMAANGMTPQMMAQYWQKMQQYFAMMQQAYAANAMGGMGQMNPQMMAQMQQMQQMQGGGMQNMNPQMQQQMMQMMQMQNGMNMGSNQQANMGPSRAAFSAQEQQAFEQQKYEQQVARRQGGSGGYHNNRGSFNNQNQGGPQSWEGMYDGEPQPDSGSQSGRGSVGAVRNNTPSGSRPPKGPTPQPQSNAPANAPTGPKNPGKPTGNFRGGRGRYHPYGR